MVATGKLTRRIQFLQHQLTGQSASGQPQRSWVAMAPCFAQVQANTATVVEQAQAETTAPVITYTIRVRYRTDVSAKTTRITMLDEGGRLLEVTGRYDPDGSRTELVILAAEVSP